MGRLVEPLEAGGRIDLEDEPALFTLDEVDASVVEPDSVGRSLGHLSNIVGRSSVAFSTVPPRATFVRQSLSGAYRYIALMTSPSTT